jgi:sacsin
MVALEKDFAAPVDVVNPRSDVAKLFQSNSKRRPHPTYGGQKSILRDLDKLDLLITDLTPEIALECIYALHAEVRAGGTNAKSRSVAAHLLQLLDRAPFHGPRIKLDLSLRWILTKDGDILAPEDCRDPSSWAFCDLIPIPLCHQEVSSNWLRQLCNWHKPVPSHTLKQQFARAVELGPTCAKYAARIWAILEELDKRTLSPDDMVDLKKAIAGKRWIPFGLDVLESQYALLTLDTQDAPHPFRDISLTISDQRKRILRKLGCLDRLVALLSSVAPN